MEKLTEYEKEIKSWLECEFQIPCRVTSGSEHRALDRLVKKGHATVIKSLNIWNEKQKTWEMIED